MSGSHFPCRICGHLTVGVDTYVICMGCSRDFEMRSREQGDERGEYLPPIVGEVEARLRKLLDD